jgi:hypothetical protein
MVSCLETLEPSGLFTESASSKQVLSTTKTLLPQPHAGVTMNKSVSPDQLGSATRGS